MRWLLGLLAIAALGCASRAIAPAASAAAEAPVQVKPALEYRLAFDAELTTLTTQVCPTGAQPGHLVSGMRDARSMLKAAWIDRATGRVPLQVDETGVDLGALAADECVGYELDLTADRGGMGAPKVHRSGAALMANLAALLWRPADYPRYGAVHASVAVPEGARVSVPWPRTGDGRYRLDETAFAFHAYAAFGKLTMHELTVAGSALELAVLDGLSPAQCAAVARWVTVQANAVAKLAGGRLPRERIQIVVLPMGESSDPIRFGSMTRGGGASAGVLIATNFDEAELMGDWVLVHELSHLLHPFVKRDEAWLSEGIATYYQEVLRARGGLQTAESAWKRILSGSQQGEAMGMSLEQGAAEMYTTYRFAPVYWGGAAVMLLADVELRRRTGGARSLDDVLMELSACCSKGSRPWPAAEVGERIDAIAGAPVMRELIANVVRAKAFPKLSQLYGQLGLDDQGRAKGDAPLAAIRDAIMVGHSPSAAAGVPSLRAEGSGGKSSAP